MIIFFPVDLSTFADLDTSKNFADKGYLRKDQTKDKVQPPAASAHRHIKTNTTEIGSFTTRGRDELEHLLFFL